MVVLLLIAGLAFVALTLILNVKLNRTKIVKNYYKSQLVLSRKRILELLEKKNILENHVRDLKAIMDSEGIIK